MTALTSSRSIGRFPRTCCVMQPSQAWRSVPSGSATSSARFSHRLAAGRFSTAMTAGSSSASPRSASFLVISRNMPSPELVVKPPTDAHHRGQSGSSGIHKLHLRILRRAGDGSDEHAAVAVRVRGSFLAQRHALRVMGCVRGEVDRILGLQPVAPPELGEEERVFDTGEHFAAETERGDEPRVLERPLLAILDRIYHPLHRLLCGVCSIGPQDPAARDTDVFHIEDCVLAVVRVGELVPVCLSCEGPRLRVRETADGTVVHGIESERKQAALEQKLFEPPGWHSRKPGEHRVLAEQLDSPLLYKIKPVCDFLPVHVIPPS